MRKTFRSNQNTRGKCTECGAEDNLQFDHRNPLEKKFTTSSRLRGLNTHEVQEELLKCQPLCESCHQKKTVIEFSGREPVNKGQWKHGTTTSYMAKGRRCEECKTFYPSYKHQQRKERGWK